MPRQPSVGQEVAEQIIGRIGTETQQHIAQIGEWLQLVPLGAGPVYTGARKGYARAKNLQAGRR